MGVYIFDDYSKFLKEETEVIIHSLGPNAPGEYRGIIRGIASIYHEYCCFYIVEFIDKIDKNYPYSCGMIISSCVREI